MRITTRGHGRTAAALLGLCLLTGAQAEANLRKIGEMELSVLGLSARVDPERPVVPRNVASAVRLVVRSGSRELSTEEALRFLGTDARVEAELSGPGLRETLTLPWLDAGEPPPADPFLIPLPALSLGGDYELSNARVVAGGRTVLDASPRALTLQVIDQVLVTSVQTRPLTLDEIRQKGIVLDSDDYLGFEFTLGLTLESKPVNLTLPVVFDRQGVAIPTPTVPPASPEREGVSIPTTPLPTIVPLLLDSVGVGGDSSGPRIPLTLPNGEPIRIPSVLVIPGNVGYLKQFFSAQLFVANGAPVGSGLTVRDVTGTIRLPEGPAPGPEDDPLSLPETIRGPAPSSRAVKGVGADGTPETSDDVAALTPGAQGQAEFLIRGEKEGFHRIDFDLHAMLEGLPVGPVEIGGRASGGVLVQNAFFDMTFTVPCVVRKDERFKLFVTVTNVGKGLANDLRVALDASRLSGATLACDAQTTDQCDGTLSIETLRPGDARTLEFVLDSDRTGQVVASYLHLDTQDGSTGQINFTLGVGERGVPLSPDTLVLPTAVDSLPSEVVDAAMRVLGQGWSIAGAPAGTLRQGVIRTSKSVVTQKALALAEAGLRVNLGQPVADAVRDVALDLFGGSPLDRGFDQLLRETEAGRDLALVLGASLGAAADAAGGALAYEEGLARLLASGPDAASFAVIGPASVAFVDGAGRRRASPVADELPAPSAAPGVVLLPLGVGAPVVGAATTLTAGPQTVEFTAMAGGSFSASLSFPRGDGVLLHGEVEAVALAQGGRARLVGDGTALQPLVLEQDADGNGTYETRIVVPTEAIASEGARLVAASVIGPELVAGASPLGFDAALLFDRVVDAAAAADPRRYAVPSNGVRVAKRQLSGRLVFAALRLPEGPYVAATVAVSGIPDARGVVAGGAQSVPLASRLLDPGAVVTGRVLNADGTPAAVGSVTYLNHVSSGENACAAAAATVPLLDGARFGLHYVRQGGCGFKLSAYDPASGALRETESFVRAGGEQLVLDIVLLGRGSVTGTVKDLQGQPVPGARVGVVSGLDPQVGGSAESDGDGHYAIAGITVGPVTVRAAKGTGVGIASGRIERAGTAAVVDVTVDGGSVRAQGTVRRLDAGAVSEALGAVVVYYYSPGGWGTTAVGATRTDEAGTFALEALPTGSFMLTATVDGQYSASIQGTAAAGDVVQGDIVIEIPAASSYGTVRGRVVSANGQPAEGVVVSVGIRGDLTGEGGVYEIPGVQVQPGVRQTVTAQSRDGLRRGTAGFVVAEAGQVVTDVDITLSGIGSAIFTLLGATGGPIANQSVGLLGACGNPCGCRWETTDAQGRASFSGLPLGPVTAQAVVVAQGLADVARGSASVPSDGGTAYGVLRLRGSGAVAGVVLDPDGRPALGADVALQSDRFVNDGSGVCGLVRTESHRARTATDGLFRFTGVNVGPVSVSASQSFYPTPVGASGTLSADGQELSLTLRLTSATAGELSGTVFMPSGVSPAGAGVEVVAAGGIPEVAVRTDDQGRYRFARILPAGAYVLTARDPVTGGVARVQVALGAGRDMTQDLRLKGRGTVRVRVVDGGDVPVTSAYVRLVETEFPGELHESAVEAASEGIATFANVFEGPFSAQASDAYARGGRVSSVLPRPGEEVDVTIRLTVTGKVEGRFLLPQAGSPIPVPFGVVRLLAAGRTIGRITTPGSGDDVGRFSFDYVPAGEVRLEAEDPLTGRTGFATGSIAHEGQVLQLDVLAQGLKTVQGLVTQNQAPVAAARVTVVSGVFSARTLSDADGWYVVPGVPEGRVVVTASLDQGFLSGTASETLTGDGEPPLRIDVGLRDSGRLAGRVTRADGVTSPPPTLVRVDVGGTGGGRVEAVAAPDGAFEFDRVPAGQASISADVIGGIDVGRATADVPAGGTAGDVLVRLHGVGSIRGRALRSDGTPIAGSITVSGGGDVPHGGRYETGADGEFRFPEFLAGPFTVSLAAQEGGFWLYGSTTETLADGEDKADVVVQVQPAGTVTGRVVRPDGTSAAYGAEVTVKLDATSAVVRLQADADGVFTARGVPLGPITVTAFDPISTGRAFITKPGLSSNGATLDVGTLVLDDRAPSVSFVEPSDGETRAPFGGNLILDLGDAGAGIDAGSVVVVYNGSAAQPASEFTIAGGRAIANLRSTWLAVGQNVLVARLRDLGGNEAQATARFTVTGGSIVGRVLQGDGTTAVPFALVGVLNGPSAVAGEDGSYRIAGLRAGTYSLWARDPATQLYASGMLVTLGDGETAAPQDVVLPKAGNVEGFVLRADGLTAAVRVTVAIGGRAAATDRTTGWYRLDGVPLGSHTIEVTDPANGDRGRGLAVLDTQGQILEALPIVLNGVAAVTVVVRDAGGVTVQGATVAVTSSPIFGGTYSGTTGPDGAVRFVHVLAGTLAVTATSPSSGLSGDASRFVGDGQDVTIPVALEPAGRIEGAVFQAGGAVAAADVQVTLSGPRTQTVLSANGMFAFEDVPFGAFQVDATEPATGDRGRTAGTLDAQQPAATANVTLNGVGTVRVLVRDASAEAVDGAAVTIASSSPFGGRWVGTTVGGEVSFPNVLAGRIDASAEQPSTGLRGSASQDLAPGASIEITVALQAVGRIAGRVLSADGSGSGVGGVTVKSGWRTAVSRESDGGYELTDVPLGTHTVAAYVGDRRRAQVDVAVSSNGQTATADLTLVGVATVFGTVSRSGGGAAAGAAVSLYSSVSLYGGYSSAAADAEGNYTVPNVPVGGFNLSATLGADRADSSGSVVTHGVDVRKDLSLVASAVALPATLFDANGIRWAVAGNGASSCNAVTATNALSLSLVTASGSVTFDGSDPAWASSEEGRRELVVSQAGLAGLDVTRKLFVPEHGYLLRAVELLTNPGSAAVTVDVVEESPLYTGTGIIATSSGDSAAGPEDRWLVTDDSDSTGIYDTGNYIWAVAPVAFGLSGPGGIAPSEVSVSTGENPRLTARWNGLVIPPGATLGLMQLVSAQADRGRAQAAAERLVQLPPEALAGLSPGEAAAIRNFAVPADLASTLEPLPSIDGTARMRVLAFDGATPVPGAGSTFVLRSASPYHGRPVTGAQLRSDVGPNVWEIKSQLDLAGVVAIPRAPFEVEAKYVSGIGDVVRTVTGGFEGVAAGQPTEVPIAFTGTSILRGRFYRSDATNTGVAGAYVYLYSEAAPSGQSTSRTSASDGTFEFLVVPPGTRHLEGRHPLGSLNVGLPVSVGGDSVVVQDLALPALGSVAGTLATWAGQPAAGSVSLTASAFTRSGGGPSFSFPDVPPGTYTLRATDPRTSASVSLAVVVEADLATTASVRFPPVGSAAVSARLSGAALASAPVYWQSDSRGPDWVWLGTTDAQGKATIPAVPGPSFRVRVEYPGVPASHVIVAKSLTVEGEAVAVEADLPGIGTVDGFVRSRDGVALGGRTVRILRASDSQELASGVAGGEGSFSLGNVPVGDLRVLGEDAPADYCSAPTYVSWCYFRGDTAASLPSHGATITADAPVPQSALRFRGQREFWDFTAAAGDSIHFAALGISYGGAPGLDDPRVEVYLPDGTLAANVNVASDSARRVQFTTTQTGRHVVAISSIDGSTGGYRIGSPVKNGVHVFRVYDGPAVTGLVRSDRADGPPLSGQRLRLVQTGVPTKETASDASGRYVLPLGPSTGFTLEAFADDGTVLARATHADTTADLVVPTRGEVSVSVKRGGIGIGGIVVSIESDHPQALSELRSRQVATEPSGLGRAMVPVGRIVARATDPLNGASVAVEGSLADASGVSLPDIVFTAMLGAIRGKVLAGDGATPLPGASVEIASGPSTTTSADGTFRFENVASGEYLLTARLGAKTASRSITVAEIETVADFTLPVPVLRGSVTDPSGEFGIVRVQACFGGYSALPCLEATVPAGGEYLIHGRPDSASSWVYVTGRFQDGSDVQADGSAYFPASFTGALRVDLSFPATGSVAGVVRSAGDAVEDATVQLLTQSGQILRTVAASGGVYRVAHVMPQAVRAYGTDADGIPGEAAGEVTAGVELPLDVDLVPTGVLTVGLHDGAGQPVSGMLAVQALEAPRVAAEPWSRSVSIGGEGGPVPETVRIPAGAYRVVFDVDGRGAGAVEGVMDVGGTQAATVIEGSHERMPVALGGGAAGSYRVEARGCGEPEWGENGLVWTCSGLGQTSVAGGSDTVRLAKPGPTGRDFTRLTEVSGGVRVVRKHYVPASASFARTLTLLSNPSSDRLVTVTVASELQVPDRLNVSVSGSGDAGFDAQDAFVVADGGLQRPRAAMVLGDALPPESAEYAPGSCYEACWPGRFTVSHSLELGPGETRALLEFTILSAGDVASVEAQARALADLTDATALLGLSRAEREAVANLQLPPTGSIEVSVSDGGSPREGAAVRLLTAAGSLLRTASTLGNGTVTLSDVPVGDYTVVAFDPIENRPARGSVTVAADDTSTVALSLLDASLAGTLALAGQYAAGGAAVVGATVELLVPGYSPAWQPRATLGDGGTATLPGLPEGPATLRWVQPASGPEANPTVVAGVTTPVTITHDGAAPFAFPLDLTGANGIPYFVHDDGRVADAGMTCTPFCGLGAYFEHAEGGDFFSSGGLATLSGRDLALGPMNIGSVSLTRRVFVTSSGSFARFFDVIENRGSADVSVLYSLDSYLASTEWAPWAVEATSSGDTIVEPDDSYWVLSAPATRVAAMVLFGAGAASPPNDNGYWDSGAGEIAQSVSWSALIVPPGSRVAVMQFVVLRPTGEVAAATAQADALATLSDPEALTGLDAADRAAIVNFAVP